MFKQKGLLIVLSGPSGVGKGTVCSYLREKQKDIIYSVSATTRKPRVGEVDGVNYFFKTKDEFEEMIKKDQLLEWAEYCGNYYGTPRTFVEETLEEGKDIILEIEVQGALKVKEKYPEGIFVFLIPPSFAELKNRIFYRGTETEDIIKSRMSIAKDELQMMKYYDYAVVNDEVPNAVKRIQSIIEAERLRKDRILPYYEQWLKEEL
ncbi:guanylate kinase [Vulcanibacillus modesticaldus]|uniref:Guanylate kinase n=1 Tax=Vulcanibacillus modesticaldus TaxID=337097 RepID=A0A1D2YTR4_9BACI|nr:guanylate kinase [Vulcanibacillus modesticaldus]OEF99088.1 guanylate kinase [Vulcanibacillus modesticaldus]